DSRGLDNRGTVNGRGVALRKRAPEARLEILLELRPVRSGTRSTPTAAWSAQQLRDAFPCFRRRGLALGVGTLTANYAIVLRPERKCTTNKTIAITNRT